MCSSFAIFSGGANRGTSGVTTVSAPCERGGAGVTCHVCATTIQPPQPALLSTPALRISAEKQSRARDAAYRHIKDEDRRRGSPEE